MKKTAICIYAFLMSSTAALADPIQDGAMAPHHAGWFPNVYKGKALSCPETCKAHASTLAEYEASAQANTKRTFVCKTPARTRQKPQRWLYGNQFDARPACYTVGLDLKGAYHKRFLCLCVKPMKTKTPSRLKVR